MNWIALGLLTIGSCMAAVAPTDDPAARSSSPTVERQSSSWRFVQSAPGDTFEHAPFRALVLTREKPEDLIEKVSYRGDSTRRRYAQIRFGSPGSIRVAVVLDELGAGEVQLYVDADRNRKIDERDRVPPSQPPAATAGDGSGSRRERIWRLQLNVAMVDKDEYRTIPRALIFRLGASGRTLGYAAAGYLAGTITLESGSESHGNGHSAKSGARTVAARRVDGDGNGLVADPQDRLWLDLSGDGQFDPATEQFLFATVLNLDGSRYIVRSDEVGTRLSMEPLTGVGTLRIALKALKAPNTKNAGASDLELHATALGRDGSVYGLSASEPAVVPVGEYRLGTVLVALGDPAGGQRWSFVFSDNGSKGEPHWYKVEKDRTLTIDPIGTPSFEVDLVDKLKTIQSGEDVRVQTAMYTGDGLLINVAYRGAPVSPALQESLGARIALTTADSQTLATAHSGFA
jgi:hypothetical protein